MKEVGIEVQAVVDAEALAELPPSFSPCRRTIGIG